MASVVKGLGRGGSAWAKRELGWDPTTLRKGIAELDAGTVCVDRFHLRGRKGFAPKLPKLQDDLLAICEVSYQTDPTFLTTRLYRRQTAAEARRQLLEKGYTQQELPSERALCRMLGTLGFKPRPVAKTKPLRKVPQTDANWLSEIWPILEKTVILHIPSSSTPPTAPKTVDDEPSGPSATGCSARQNAPRITLPVDQADDWDLGCFVNAASRTGRERLYRLLSLLISVSSIVVDPLLKGVTASPCPGLRRSPVDIFRSTFIIPPS